MRIIVLLFSFVFLSCKSTYNVVDRKDIVLDSVGIRAIYPTFDGVWFNNVDTMEKYINELPFAKKVSLKWISYLDLTFKIKANSNEYLTALQTIAEKKLPLIKESNSYKKSSKLAAFLISKGFESELVFKTVKTLI